MTPARLAVLGNPIAHSRSPEIHQAFARQASIDLTYERLLVPEGQFAAVAQSFVDGSQHGAPGLGFNVTLPCKHEAWQWVDRATDAANFAQAVNTVSRDENGKFVGDNTDGAGLVADLTKNLGWQVRDARILIIGAGGAVSGVLGPLVAARPSVIHLFNRTQEKARQLANRFDHTTVAAVDSTQLEPGYDLVINGTSAGLAGQQVSLPDRIVASHSDCYDMVYGPAETVFNAWCRERGAARQADGLGMLVEQASLAFSIWFHREVATQSVAQDLRATL